MVCLQASNRLITSQTYQKWSGDVVLGRRGMYCSVYKLQNRIGLIKTPLISSVLCFKLEIGGNVEFCLGWLSLLKPIPHGDRTASRIQCFCFSLKTTNLTNPVQNYPRLWYTYSLLHIDHLYFLLRLVDKRKYQTDGKVLRMAFVEKGLHMFPRKIYTPKQELFLISHNLL